MIATAQIQRQLDVWIPGDPAGKRRHRAGVNQRTRRPVQFKDDAAVRQERYTCFHIMNAIKELRAGGRVVFPIPAQVPIEVEIRAFYRVPESWSARKKERAAQGQIEPTGKPDLDNVEKHLLDCCARKLAGVWFDDAQVVAITTRKSYASFEIGIALKIRWRE